MPDWNNEGARDMAFKDIDSYKINYCRHTPDNARTLAGTVDLNDIELRREISKWLSEVAPHAIHRSPGFSTPNRPWLTVGRVKSGNGNMEGISRIGVFWWENKNWIGIQRSKGVDSINFSELKIVNRSFRDQDQENPADQLDRIKEAYNSLLNSIQPVEIVSGSEGAPTQSSYLCWSYEHPEDGGIRVLLGNLLEALDICIYKVDTNGYGKYLRRRPNVAVSFLMPSFEDEELIQPPSLQPSAYMKPTNLILYGPPGTGKTFATIGLALSCCDSDRKNVSEYASNCLAGTYAKPPDRDLWIEWLDDFESLRTEGRIEFTTFHQNYSYEDFVEGIRAKTASQGEKDKAGEGVTYTTEPGIFKKIAYRALYAWLRGDRQPCPIGKEDEEKARVDVLKWLEDGTWDLASSRDPSDADALPYVLIIDEINRGNMARILGELITLLEDSKRARHQKELGHQPLKATLPYTREPFIVPPNLYIIGTMNTADRSLIGLDVALRRRFQFVELPPRPEALATTHDGVDLNVFLTALNKRIARQLDADHLIGHAFFVGVKSIDELKNVMIQKVIPLLREYFHDRPDDLEAVLDVQGEDKFRRFDRTGGNLRFTGADPDALKNPEVYQRFSGAAPQ
jgi:hypothetical protein